MKRPGGEVVAGTLQADSQALALQQIRKMGGAALDVIRLDNVGDKPAGLLASLGFGKHINTRELLAFTSQMAVMSKAGLGLTTTLGSISEQIKSPYLGQVVQTLKRDVESGRQFSEALQRFPKIFSLLYVNMVRASELSGSFGHMLERIGDYLNQQVETKRQVTGAMIYPLIIVVMAITTTVFMLTFVLPRFMVLFEGKEDILPIPTKVLMALSYSLCTYCKTKITSIKIFICNIYRTYRHNKLGTFIKIKMTFVHIF